MENNIQLFGQLFTKFRLRAEFLTLSEFGKALAGEGLLYEDSIFSRWQRGNRIPKDRRVLLSIIRVFVKRGGIRSVSDANMLLESAIHGYLTNAEEHEIFKKNTCQYEQSENPIISTRSLHPLEEDFNLTLSTIINSSEKLLNIEKQATMLNERIYKGYSSLSYERLGQLIEVIKMQRLDHNQQGKDIVSKISWMRLRCLSDLYGTASEYDKALEEAKSALQYAKEYSVSEISAIYWMYSSLLRKKILVQTKTHNSKTKMLESLAISQLAISSISKENVYIKITTYLEIIYFALALRDVEMFDKAMFNAITLIEDLPADFRFIKALVWDAKARGCIRFGLKIDAALDNINVAKLYASEEYKNVTLNLHSTEFQALESSPDSEYKKYAEKLRNTLYKESTITGNPYQRMRFEKKKFRGL